MVPVFFCCWRPPPPPSPSFPRFSFPFKIGMEISTCFYSISERFFFRSLVQLTFSVCVNLPHFSFIATGNSDFRGWIWSIVALFFFFGVVAVVCWFCLYSQDEIEMEISTFFYYYYYLNSSNNNNKNATQCPPDSICEIQFSSFQFPTLPNWNWK